MHQTSLDSDENSYNITYMALAINHSFSLRPLFVLMLCVNSLPTSTLFSAALLCVLNTLLAPTLPCRWGGTCHHIVALQTIETLQPPMQCFFFSSSFSVLRGEGIQGLSYVSDLEATVCFDIKSFLDCTE
jgi:hypothetical protein